MTRDFPRIKLNRNNACHKNFFKNRGASDDIIEINPFSNPKNFLEIFGERLILVFQI